MRRPSTVSPPNKPASRLYEGGAAAKSADGGGRRGVCETRPETCATVARSLLRACRPMCESHGARFPWRPNGMRSCRGCVRMWQHCAAPTNSPSQALGDRLIQTVACLHASTRLSPPSTPITIMPPGSAPVQSTPFHFILLIPDQMPGAHTPPPAGL